MTKKRSGAELVVKCLEAHGVKFVFGIPGAKIDAVFNALEDSSIELIVCRHEQNAAFMAACYGRVTGQPGVVLVTSGPGVANLTTGLLTATTEGDPVIAIGGNVPLSMSLKATHQNTKNAELLAPVTKSSVEVSSVANINEAFNNAFRLAQAPRRGACFISLPQDILSHCLENPCAVPSRQIALGPAPEASIAQLAQAIAHAKQPVLLLGEEASQPEVTEAVRKLVRKLNLPTVGTFQAAGVIPRDLVHCFAGRVGLFRNQPGDQLLDHADLVITVGYNLIEYDPEIWNPNGRKTIAHIDACPAEIHDVYQPEYELIGDIAKTVEQLVGQVDAARANDFKAIAETYHQKLLAMLDTQYQPPASGKVHPAAFVKALRAAVDDDTTVICDVGTVYMWMARYFLSFQPHKLLFSNGQQTLGIALPWAMAVQFDNPGSKVISISGDGGFLFSAMELETAVRHKLNFVHFIWCDGAYNMVLEQELMKYKRKAAVDFNDIDHVQYAEAFGATGFRLTDVAELPQLLEKAMAVDGPVLIEVPVDYRDNPALFEVSNPCAGN